MDIFFLLPPEYLRGIVYLSDRSNSIDQYHKTNLEYLTHIIENKATQRKQSEDDKNQNLVNFKKKVQNLPKDALISIFLQYLSMIFPEFRNESLTFCKTGVLEVRSQTLKLWRERFLKFNYQTKNFEVFTNKEKDQKTAKYSFNLGGYVIRWIDKDKCLFSLDSINYKNRYKSFLFKAKNNDALNDWYENIQFALNFEKFQEFEFSNKKVETFNVIEDFRKKEPISVISNSDDILFKKRFYSKSALPNVSPLLPLKGINKQITEKITLSSSKTEINLKESISEVNKKFKLSFQTDTNKKNYESKINHETSYEGSFLLSNEKEMELLEESKFTENNVSKSFVNTYPTNFLSEEEKLSDGEDNTIFSPLKKEDNNFNDSPLKKPFLHDSHMILHDSVYSSANFHHFDKITEKFNLQRMCKENNYEMISDDGSLRIVRNVLNDKKYKVFLTFPYYTPIIASLFLEPILIKKWNQNISEYKILSKLSHEKKLSIIYDERKKLSHLYLQRYFVYQRCVYHKDPDTTLIFGKSINYSKGEIPTFSIRGNINYSLLSISKVNFQTKIALFLDVDFKGFLTKSQNLQMAMECFQNLKNLRKLLENEYLMDFSECLIPKSITQKNQPIIKFNNPPPPKEELQIPILLKRKSTPNITACFSDDEQTIKEREIKRRLHEVTSNLHIINCIRQTKSHRPFINTQTNEKNDYLFVKNFWTIFTSGKFEYLDSSLINNQKNFLLSQSPECLDSMKFYLPMEFLEPISELEKLAHLFSFAPLIFKDLSEFDKPIDQMKIVVIFIFSLLFLGISQKLPFSSFLGETFQAKIGNFLICAEKISEDPEISCIMLSNEFVAINAKFNLNFDIQRNSCKITNQGFLNVFFKRNRTKFSAKLPSLLIEGVREGPRTVHYEGSLIVIENEKCLIAEVNFDGKENFIKTKKEKFNDFFGEIFSVSRKMVIYATEGKNWKQVENDKYKRECKIFGSLSSSIEFDGETYWSFDKHYPYYIQSVENPLPSDSKFRKDILFHQLRFEEKAELEAKKFRTNKKI